MNKRDIRPIVGYSYPVTVEKLREMLALKGGLLVRGTLPQNKEEAMAAVRFCRKNGIRILLGEIVPRGELRKSSVYSPEDFQEIVKEAGDALLGVYGLGEGGGILYWPKYYTMNRAAKTWKSLEKADSPADARKKLVEYFRKFVELQRSIMGSETPLCIVESSQILQYQKEAGADFFLHEMCPGNPLELLPAYRGMARACHTIWGTHIAIGWYGGIRMDELWMKRWKLCLYLAFLQGADIIYPESGHYTYQVDKWGETRWNMFDRDHPNLLRSRRILREFYRFCMIHQRPTSDPETRIGILFGRNEGFPNLWNPYAWGQYENGTEWEAGPPEQGWKLPQALLRKENVFQETVMGDCNRSGNPAGGQYDVVPLETAEDLSRYKALAFVGWNDMNDAQYAKLLEYVRNGGHLLIWPAHCNVSGKRTELRLYRDGDLSELCGLRIKGWKTTDVRGFKFVSADSLLGDAIPYWGSRHDPWWMGKITPAEIEITEKNARILAGFSYHIREYDSDLLAEPALIEHRVGKGMVWTVAVREYPGDGGAFPFAEALLRILNTGEMSDPDAVCPEQIRYAIYHTEISGIPVRIFYLLNTETECSAGFRFRTGGKLSREYRLEPAGFTAAYLIDSMLILPCCNAHRLYEVHGDGDSLRLEFHMLEECAVLQEDLSGKKRKLFCNGREGRCPARREEDLAEYYAPDFLEEPDITQYPHHAPFVHITQKLQS